MQQAGWVFGGSIGAILANRPGRFGGLALNTKAGNNTATLALQPRTRYMIGFAAQPIGVTGGSKQAFFRLQNAAGNPIVSVSTENGFFTVDGTAVTPLPQFTQAQQNIWYYFEIDLEVGFDAGALSKVRLKVNFNGEQVYNAELANLSGNQTSINSFRLSGDRDFDDLYVLDETGTDNNSLLGDRRVAVRIPRADADVQFAPSPVGSNFANVDEVPHDGDGTFNASSTPGAHDLFTSTDDTGGVALEINAVQITTVARKTDTGARGIAGKVKVGSDIAVSATANLTAAYAFNSAVFEKAPNGSDWTTATVESSQFGYEVV